MRPYYGWVIVATLTSVSLISAATVGFTFGLFVLPMGSDLNLSRAALGWTQTARLGANGVSSLFLGPLIDRYGTRVLIPLAGVVSAGALWLMSESSAYWIILLGFGALGVVEFHFPGNLLTTVPIGKWFVRERGKAASLAAAGIAMGAITFALTHQYLLDSIGWRETFRISAIVILVGTVPLPLLLLRRTPEDMGLLPDGAATLVISGAQDSPVITEDPGWSLREATRTLTMWKIVAAYSLTNLAAGSFMIHRAPFWTEQGIATSWIAGVFALDALMFAASTLTAGALITRIAPRHLAAIAMAAQATGIAVATAWVSVPTMLLSSPLLGAGAGINAVVVTVIWADYYGRPSLGAIRSVSVPLILVGFAIGPPAVGALYGLSGDSYVSGFALLAALLAMAAVIVTTATRPLHSSES
jgi:MFS family permease